MIFFPWGFPLILLAGVKLCCADLHFPSHLQYAKLCCVVLNMDPLQSGAIALQIATMRVLATPCLPTSVVRLNPCLCRYLNLSVCSAPSTYVASNWISVVLSKLLSRIAVCTFGCLLYFTVSCSLAASKNCVKLVQMKAENFTFPRN